MTEPITSRTGRRIIEQARDPGAGGDMGAGGTGRSGGNGDMRVVVDFSEVLTYRTLAAIDDAPPAPLILGLLEPEGPTMMYGPPGLGKGTSAAWLVVELQRLGYRPLVYDAEQRPREWARRVSGLGGVRHRVGYMTPTDLGPTRAGRPLWENIEQIATALTATSSDVLIVDSALPAIGVGEDRLKSDAQAPYLYVQALDSLGVPSLTLGHTPKGDPGGDPFGSMAWVAAMRLTWIGSRVEGGMHEQIGSSGDDAELHRVRWMPRKRNERGELPGLVLTFLYDDGGRLVRVVTEDERKSTTDRILAILSTAAEAGDGPLRVADIVAEMATWAEGDSRHADDEKRLAWTVGKALYRLKKLGLALPDKPTGRGTRWSIGRPNSDALGQD